MFRMTVDTKDFHRVADWIEKPVELINNPDIYTRPVKILGSFLFLNFATEGGMVGGWQHLAQLTQDVREERGYGREHPIMVQSGQLRSMSAETLMNWRMGAMGYQRADKTGTKMSATLSPGRFSATIAGPKVENQAGGFAGGFAGIGGVSMPGASATRYGQGGIPPRPFFFIPEAAIEPMTSALADAFMSAWQSSGGKGVKRQYGRMTVLPTRMGMGR